MTSRSLEIIEDVMESTRSDRRDDGRGKRESDASSTSRLPRLLLAVGVLAGAAFLRRRLASSEEEEWEPIEEFEPATSGDAEEETGVGADGRGRRRGGRRGKRGVGQGKRNKRGAATPFATEFVDSNRRSPIQTASLESNDVPPSRSVLCRADRWLGRIFRISVVALTKELRDRRRQYTVNGDDPPRFRR